MDHREPAKFNAQSIRLLHEPDSLQFVVMPKGSKLVQEELTVIYSTVRESISYRRSREEQIFTWSAAFLAAITSALLFSEIDKSSLIASCFGKILSTVLVLLVSLGSCFWQLKQRKLLCSSQALAAKLMDEMKLFDVKSRNGEQLVLPEAWRTWGSRNNSFWTQLGQPSKVLCTVLLGIAAIVVIWKIRSA